MSMKKLLIALALLVPAIAGASTFEGTLSTGVQTGIEGIVVTAPTATPGSGTYDSTQSVTLTATGAQSIRYRDDGGVPTCSVGTPYTGAISVSASISIQARSCYANNASSSPVVFLYVINPPATPAPSGGGGGGGGGGLLPPSGTTGDATGDGRTDIFDFNIVLINWGATTGGVSAGDLNGDGQVDITDFNTILTHWTF